MAFVQELLSSTSIPRVEREAALSRVFQGPDIPCQDGTTTSFWLKNPHPELHNLQSSVLPNTADVVIIGSGITGTSVARTLLSKPAAAEHGLRVVLLDARDICSGATGRNGGHCLETVEDYSALKDEWGKDAAQRITKFRLRHLSTLMAVAEVYGIVEEAQVRKVHFLSAHFDHESFAAARASIKAFMHDMPEESAEWGIVEEKADMREYGLSNAVGIITGPAGALWPYRFVTSVLADLRHKHGANFSIEANTPVSQITKDDQFYYVKTPRGLIRSRHVVHCTNGHAAHLVPELSGSIYPVRGQMSAQIPPPKLPCQSHKHSWLFNYGRGFDYLTQLPVLEGLCDGEMMLGGGFASSAYHGIREIGVGRDDDLDTKTGIHLENALSEAFDDCSQSHTMIKAMWTGTMGFSADGLPWVGQIPHPSIVDLDSSSWQGEQWIAAGFSGEGMVNTWLSGEVLGRLILGHEQGRTEQVRKELCGWFPEEMFITEERLRRSKLPKSLPSDEGMEQAVGVNMMPQHAVTPARL